MLKRFERFGGLGGKGGWPFAGDFPLPNEASEGKVLGGVVEAYPEFRVELDLLYGGLPFDEPFVEPLVRSEGAL